LGYPLRTPRLVLSAISYALDLALNPKNTAEKIVGRLWGSAGNGSKRSV